MVRDLGLAISLDYPGVDAGAGGRLDRFRRHPLGEDAIQLFIGLTGDSN
ncbi:MAG: hypothetical protein R3A10_13455 [Caldilineaceae bacterium]